MHCWIIFLIVLSAIKAANGCGCCTPCAPLPPPCPPPVICPPPPICPPPMPCPPPVIPLPCPPPPPCIPPPVIVQHVCCVTCVSSCYMRARKRRDVSSQNFTAAISNLNDDPICNNMKLRTIMQESMTEKDPHVAMAAVRKAIEKKLTGKYTVICANGDFSYSAFTDSFCQTRNDPLTCYAFKPLITSDALTIASS